jgi:phosphoribosylaminoimidazole-succinocarboxamide synthase
MTQQALMQTELPEFDLLNRGKVRDIYDLGNHLLIIATDRISAFDSVLANGIPGKGRVLTSLSRFWFDFTSPIARNHLVTTDLSEMGRHLDQHADQLEGRSMLVKKTDVLPVECVVRGYLAGSGWRDYVDSGVVSGVKLSPGLRQADKLPEPIVTPSTKAETGHDEPIDHGQMEEIIGQQAAAIVRDKSLQLYETAAAYARERGIIIADTKFE